jgi:hypothetical protein
MKSILSLLATTLLLSFSSVSMAAEVTKGAKDCAKTSRPELCEALKAAEEACKDKAGADRKACVKEKLKTS